MAEALPPIPQHAHSIVASDNTANWVYTSGSSANSYTITFDARPNQVALEPETALEWLEDSVEKVCAAGRKP